ncbi:hypothetical protein [Nonomuraea longicatena]|uniref:Transposase n=1 Tax=Nonomuraea longicatena TaxID=83682 RepID=A0ABN1PTA5_9ACTN
MAVWRTPDGVQVEAIVLDDRPVLRISRQVGDQTYLYGYCASVDDLAEHGIDLAQLTEPRPAS